MRSQREEILRVLRCSGRHMRADEIYLACRTEGVSLSMATIYRNLGSLTEQGLLRRVPIPGKADCYDVTVQDHGHLVCEVCGDVLDIETGDLMAQLEKRLGLSVTSYDLCLHYVCPACREKQTSEPV